MLEPGAKKPLERGGEGVGMFLSQTRREAEGHTERARWLGTVIMSLALILSVGVFGLLSIIYIVVTR